MTDRTPCESCGQPFGIGDWPICPHGRPHGSIGRPWHPTERATVFRNGTTGKLSYPMMNNVPTPAGYERIEVSNDRQMAEVEALGGVRSDARWFDKGSGHADHMPEHKPIDLTGLEFGTLD